MRRYWEAAYTQPGGEGVGGRKPPRIKWVVRGSAAPQGPFKTPFRKPNDERFRAVLGLWASPNTPFWEPLSARIRPGWELPDHGASSTFSLEALTYDFMHIKLLGEASEAAKKMGLLKGVGEEGGEKVSEARADGSAAAGEAENTGDEKVYVAAATAGEQDFQQQDLGECLRLGLPRGSANGRTQSIT